MEFRLKQGEKPINLTVWVDGELSAGPMEDFLLTNGTDQSTLGLVRTINGLTFLVDLCCFDFSLEQQYKPKILLSGTGIAPGETNEDILWCGVEVGINEDGTGEANIERSNGGLTAVKVDIGRRLTPIIHYATVEREHYSFADVGSPRTRQVPIGVSWDR